MNKIILAILIVIFLIFAYIGIAIYLALKVASKAAAANAAGVTMPMGQMGTSSAMVPASVTTVPSSMPWGCYPQTSGSSTYGILGRASDGTIQCLTPDGTNCNWYSGQSACQTGLTGMGSNPSGQPLVCGSPTMINTYGPVGPNANAWCQTRTDF